MWHRNRRKPRLISQVSQRNQRSQPLSSLSFSQIPQGWAGIEWSLELKGPLCSLSQASSPDLWLLVKIWNSHPITRVSGMLGAWGAVMWFGEGEIGKWSMHRGWKDNEEVLLQGEWTAVTRPELPTCPHWPTRWRRDLHSSGWSSAIPASKHTQYQHTANINFATSLRINFKHSPVKLLAHVEVRGNATFQQLEIWKR